MSTHPTPATEPARMTLAQWAALDAEVRGELVDGALVEEEEPNAIHGLLVAWLVATLHAWGRPRRVVVLASGVKLALTDDRGRIPDVAVYLPQARRPPPRGVVDARRASPSKWSRPPRGTSSAIASRSSASTPRSG